MTSYRMVISAGVLGVILVVLRAIVQQTDALVCSLAVIAIAGMVIVFTLWHWPRPFIVVIAIAVACGVGVLG